MVTYQIVIPSINFTSICNLGQKYYNIKFVRSSISKNSFFLTFNTIINVQCNNLGIHFKIASNSQMSKVGNIIEKKFKISFVKMSVCYFVNNDLASGMACSLQSNLTGPYVGWTIGWLQIFRTTSTDRVCQNEGCSVIKDWSMADNVSKFYNLSKLFSFCHNTRDH